MDAKQHIAWLYSQLPGLVEDGTLTAEAAAKLHRRYGDVELGSGRRRAVVLFGVLGAALIGGGIILLLAHNWDELSRVTRAALSLLPLLIGQALCFWVLLRRADSTAWREGAGAFLTMAIGSSIALVSQTYHVGGAFSDFMLAWVLLALPIAYLLPATLPATLYLIGILAWLGAPMIDSPSRWWLERSSLGYWILLALALPWWWLQLRENRYHSRATLFGWALALTVPVGFGMSIRHVLDAVPQYWSLWGSAIAAAMFLAGSRWWPHATTMGQRPLQAVGGLALICLGLALSFKDIWGIPSQRGWARAFDTPVELVVATAVVVGALALWADSLRKPALTTALLGAMPIAVLLGVMLANASSLAAMILFNLYMLAIGVGVLVAGFRAQNLGAVNAGMIILSALIFCRFFDADIGFVARGLAFIAVGAGFLVANLVMLRKKGAAAG